MKASRWNAFVDANPRAAVRLFCFPYAGGGAWVFRTWSESLPTTVQVCPVELPGRGSRLREAPLTNLPELVELAAAELRPYFDRPFAFFGHSLGALLGFELSRSLRKTPGPQPAHLFVSGRRAPHLASPDPPIHALPEADFVERLRDLNGTPKAVLDDAELMELLLPTLRADFAVNETYVYEPGELAVEHPLTVFGGLNDEEASREDLEAWRMHTTGAFSLSLLPGDHFFITTARERLLDMLSRELDHLAKRILGES